MEIILSKKTLYCISKIVTPESLVYINKIGELKGKQSAYTNLRSEYLTKLQINAIIDNTLSSNSIDGLTINNKRFKELFEELKPPSNNIESEIVRYIKVINLINSHSETLKLSPELILQFHRNIFRYKPDQGGNWRTDDILQPDLLSKEFSIYPDAKDIPECINFFLNRSIVWVYTEFWTSFNLFSNEDFSFYFFER